MIISPPIQAANLSMGDSLILMVIALVVLGPRRLPQVGRQIGKLMFEFRKASNDFKFQMEEELRNAEDADRRAREEAERQRALAEAQSAATQAQSAATQALNAAAEAQNAAQAAQTAAVSQSSGAEAVTAEDSAAAVPTESAESPANSRPDYFYPYSGETEPNREETTGEKSSGEPALRVQPPSTGEQVAADRPGRVAGEAEPASESAAESNQSEVTAGLPAGMPLKKDVAAEGEAAPSESTAHHG